MLSDQKLPNEIETLLKKSADASNALDAMQYSQAAVNAGSARASVIYAEAEAAKLPK